MAETKKHGKGRKKPAAKPRRKSASREKETVRDADPTPTLKDIEDSIIQGTRESLASFRKTIAWKR